MKAVTLSTEHVGVRSRLAYWTDLVCSSFVELDCMGVGNDRFFGSIENTTGLDVQFSNIVASAQHVSRRRSTISRSDRDYFLLSMQTQGQGIVEQDGRRAVLQPGDMALYDTTRAYDLRFPDTFGQIVLRLPRDLITRSLCGSERMTAVRIKGDEGTGSMASTFIRQLHGQVSAMGPDSLARLNGIGVDLIATALAEQVGATASLSDARYLLQRRISDFVDANLHDSNLTCEVVAARHHVSERYLRKIFQASNGSVSDLIWSRRLEHARRDLQDPLKAHLSVASIGYGVGFKDTGHFSRAFKAKFGVTPRDSRNGCNPVGSDETPG